MKSTDLKMQYRINDRIRAKEVRLVGDDLEQGVYSIQEALNIADKQQLDLVEISPNAVPPVCKVIDYQKFLYQQKKRQKDQKAKSLGHDSDNLRNNFENVKVFFILYGTHEAKRGLKLNGF